MSLAGAPRRFEHPRGVGLAYCEYGDPAGSPVLFIHGCIGSRLSAAPFHPAALAKWFRIIAVDKPGFGRSDPRAGMTLSSWAGIVEALFEHLGLVAFDVVASSGGTPYGLSCAASLPQAVRTLALINPIRESDGSGGLIGLAERHPSLSRMTMRPVGAAFRRMPSIATRILHRRELAFLRVQPDVHANRRDTIREAFRQGVAGLHDELRTYSRPWGISLNSLKPRVLLFASGNEAHVRMIEHYRALIPLAEPFAFPAEGHLSLAYSRVRTIFDLMREPTDPDRIVTT